MNAADLAARIEGDMKVAKTDEENIKEEMKHEVPGETQPTQLDKPVWDAQEIASQLQALEAMRMGGRRKTEESKDRSRKERLHHSSLPCRKPQQCSQQHQRAETGSSDDRDCTFVLICSSCESGGQKPRWSRSTRKS